MHGYFVSQRMLFHFGNMEYCLIFCMFGCLWMFFGGVVHLLFTVSYNDHACYVL